MTARDWVSMAFTARDKTEGNELYFQSMWRSYEFSPGLLQMGDEPELSR